MLPYELLMGSVIVGFLTPVFASDWGKCTIISLTAVVGCAVVWMITGIFSIALCSLCYAAGLEIGFRIRNKRAVMKLRQAILDHERLFKFK